MSQDTIASDPRELLTANVALVGRIVASTCRRCNFNRFDAEEFASIVNLRLVENNFAVLRKYEHRSSLATFLAVVIGHIALDYRIQMWGKWHPSAEAKRLGALAVDIEMYLRRDGRSLDEILPLLRQRYGDVTLKEIEAFAARLPKRQPRRRFVDITEAEEVAGSGEDVEDAAMDSERSRSARRICAAIDEVLSRQPREDRLILQLRYQSGMSVVQIARTLGIEQKLLYRRLERQMKTMRAELCAMGIDTEEALDLIGRPGVLLDFVVGTGETRPSKEAGDEVAAQREASS